MASRGLKSTAWTGAECPLIRESGPRCAVEVEVDVLRRLLLFAEGSRVGGASGEEDGTLLHIPILSSADAERMRFEGAWTSME